MINYLWSIRTIASRIVRQKLRVIALLHTTILACCGQVSELASEPKTANQKIAHDYLAAGLTAELDVLEGILSEEFVNHQGDRNKKQTIDAIKDVSSHIENLRPEVEEYIESGDRVVTRTRFKGQIPSTGQDGKGSARSFQFESIDIFEIKGGKINQHWGQDNFEEALNAVSDK